MLKIRHFNFSLVETVLKWSNLNKYKISKPTKTCSNIIAPPYPC
jgi:hypothetical protein